MNNSPFVLHEDAYQRDADVIKFAKEQTSHILMRTYGIDKDEADKFTESTANFIDPDVQCLVRQANGDREKKTLKLSKILDRVSEKVMPMSPSMTIYDNPNVNRSILADFCVDNAAQRAIFKNEKKQAQLAQDAVKENISENKQQGKKRSNNSLSGAQVSVSTNLNNKTAHSSLTSTCRVSSGYGNANNEKFIIGNRHYWSPDIIMGNIASISTMSDLVAIDATMKHHGLYYPDADDCWSMIKESSQFYLDIEPFKGKIYKYLEGLLPVERAAFMYVGDMHHLAKYNGSVVGDLLLSMSKRPEAPLPESEVKEIESYVSGDLWTLCNYNAKEFVQGRKHGELMKDSVNYRYYLQVAKNVVEALKKYSDIVSSFWVTPNLPCSVAELPTIIRRAVPASDTDSTIFTVANWVEKYHDPKTMTDDDAFNICNSVVFLCSQSIVHILAMMSANMNVDKKKLFKMTMKNEFLFMSFAVTNATKHYYAHQSAVEGTIMKKTVLELKGVNLKASTSPPSVVAKCHAMIDQILETTAKGKQLEFHGMMKEIADIERDIIRSIEECEPTYLKRSNVKNAESYQRGVEEPTYKSHDLWDTVFAGSKYGRTPEIPYRALRFNMDIPNKTAMKEWVEGFEDKDCKEKLEAWLTKNDKDTIGTMLVPESIAREQGIPHDIIRNVDVRRTIANNMGCFYVMLTALDLYHLDKKCTKLISDCF